MSLLPSDDPPPPAASAKTLADVLSLLECDPQIRLGHKRELTSALRTIARALGKDLASLPSEPRQLRELISAVSIAGQGITEARWANVCSLLRKALQRVGIKAMLGRARDPLAPAWEAL